MALPPGADPEWVAMQLQHDRERGEFNRQVEADQQEYDRRVAAAQAAFSRKAEAEKQALHRRMEAEQAGMLARHSQQEGEYWLRRKQKATKTLSPTLVAPQPIKSKAQSTPSRPSAAPGCAPRKRPLPTPDPAGKQSSLQACDDQSEDEQQAMSARRAQQKARPQLKQLFVTPQPGKPGQPKSNVTSSRIKRVPKKEPEMIDLCSSDDNLLVEVTRAAYQNTTAATLQRFGESSQKQSSLPRSAPIKQEKSGVAQLAQGQPQPPVSRPAQNNVNKPIVFQRAATAVPSRARAQPTLLNKAPHPFDKELVISGNVLRQQVQDTSKLTVNQDPIALQQRKLNGGFANDILENNRTEDRALGFSKDLARRDSGDDVDMEDIPLILLNSKEVLKKLGKDISKDNVMDVDLSTAGIAERPNFNMNEQKTHLPSPSPSLPTTPTESTGCEATSLLKAFKRPALPLVLKNAPDVRARNVESRASSCTLKVTPVPNKIAYLQRQASVVSHTSNTSNLSRKRKVIDLSDDEQSDCVPSEPPSVGGRRKSVVSSGSPIKKPKATTAALLKPKGPPPPSVSPLSILGKRTSGFGFRTKATPAFPTTSTTPSGSPTIKSKPSTPITPTQSTADRRAKALSTPPSKRKAAVRAQSNIRITLIEDDRDDTCVEDPDTGEFAYTNGVIIQAGQEGRLAEMKVEGGTIENGEDQAAAQLTSQQSGKRLERLGRKFVIPKKV